MPLFLCAFLTLHAQDTQVAVDNDGKKDVIEASLGSRIDLFKEYPGFIEARLFEMAQNEYSLEIYYKPDDRILRKRINYTSEDVHALRGKVSAALRVMQSDTTLNQDGRAKLLIASSVAGLGYYGWAIPAALDMQSSKAIASTYMFTSALSFFVPFAATRNSTVTEASANAYIYGTTRGIIHGLAINAVIFGNDGHYRRKLAFSMAGSLAEGVALYKVSSLQNWSTGRAELSGVGGDFGLLIGLSTPILFNREGGRLQPAAGLIGSAAGMAAGHRLAGREHYTQGDAYVLRGAGTMGSYTALSVTNLSDTENENIYAGAFIVGSVGGLVLGHRLAYDRDFTAAQGTFIELGQLAGWFTGLGIAYLIKDPASSDSRLFMTLSAAGGIGGYALMYNIFADKAREKAAGRTSWDFQFTPQNILLSKWSGSNSKSNFPLPLAALNVQF